MGVGVGSYRQNADRRLDHGTSHSHQVTIHRSPIARTTWRALARTPSQWISLPVMRVPPARLTPRIPCLEWFAVSGFRDSGRYSRNFIDNNIIPDADQLFEIGDPIKEGSAATDSGNETLVCGRYRGTSTARMPREGSASL